MIRLKEELIMKIKICLRYAREPELVALRFNPGIYMPGLAKQALRAQMEGQDFQIHMQKDVNYVQKPLSFYLTLDDEMDKDIIHCLNSHYAPATAFIRNILIRCIKGNVNFIYSDLELKKMALSNRMQEQKEDKPQVNSLRATMAQSDMAQEKANISEKGKDDALLLAALELSKY